MFYAIWLTFQQWHCICCPLRPHVTSAKCPECVFREPTISNKLSRVGQLEEQEREGEEEADDEDEDGTFDVDGGEEQEAEDEEEDDETDDEKDDEYLKRLEKEAKKRVRTVGLPGAASSDCCSHGVR